MIFIILLCFDFNIRVIVIVMIYVIEMLVLCDL